MEPVTMAIVGGAAVAKGASGYKAGQNSAKSAMATAQYNAQISKINAQMEQDRGRIVRAIDERNADIVGEQSVYNAYLIDRQATQIEDQNEFDFFMAERQYDIFTSEKRAKWGNSGVTMSGSPAVVAMADANAAALNLANIEQRGYQAVSRTEQAAEMTRYKGKVDYNNMMQQAFMGQYNSDIQRASIINQGNMNYYAGASKAYQAQQSANAALIGSIADGVSSLATGGAFASGGSTTLAGGSGSVAGGGFNSLRGGTGSTQIPTGFG